MRWLGDQGYDTVSLAQLAGSLPTTMRRPVVITFDDGYADFLDGAWPALDEQGFRASIFLPTAYVGASRQHFKGRACLNASEILDLHRRGVSMGSHTVSHPKLYGMPWEEVSRELHQSRADLESLLAAPVDTFAYPFAFPQHDTAFIKHFRSVLADAGYRTSVTTVVGRHVPGDDVLRIKRLPVNEADDLALFAAKMRGAYDWVGTAQRAVKRVRGAFAAARPNQHSGAGVGGDRRGHGA